MQPQLSDHIGGPSTELHQQPSVDERRSSENLSSSASHSRSSCDNNDVSSEFWSAQYPSGELYTRSSNIYAVDTESSCRPEFDHMEDVNAVAECESQNETSSTPPNASTKGVASRVLGRLKSFPSNGTPRNASEDQTCQSIDHSDNMDSEKTYHTSVQDESIEQSDSVNTDTNEFTREALQLVRSFTTGNVNSGINAQNGSSTPEDAPDDRYYYDYDYVPAPPEYKPSIFGAILASRLNAVSSDHRRARDLNNAFDFRNSRISLLGKHSPKHKRAHSVEPPTSGTTTPNKKVKWYDKPDHSVISNMLVQSGLSSSGPGLPESTSALSRSRRPRARSFDGTASPADLEKGLNVRHSQVDSFGSSNETLVDEVADIIARRKYLTKLCAAFMKYGAPTHRMEEYLAASARALAIDADFLYIPGAMVCTFIDHSIYANNIEVVRKNAGLDLGRLKDAFNVYKNIIHQKYSAQEGISELDEIEKRPDEHGDLFGIFMFGLASVIVGPFSFNTRPIDFGPIFVLGCALGFMQLKIVPRSHQFSNVFEVFSCVLIAFISRALGSIKWNYVTYVFCFYAFSQSSIAMILPGFLVLNSALELQGKNMVSGSVRMVYAIIYVLFLGFGLLIGTTVFGLVKRDAVTDVTCSVPEWFEPGLSYKLIYTRFIWAPLFAACVALIYKAKWSQLGVMALIATAGHQANFWISTQLSSNLQVANAIGAFAIGCIANLYSRLFHGLAAAAMLPAIYCQVPGGLAASGSLVAGVDSSNQIFGNNSAISVINNGTSGFVAAQNDPSSVYGGTIYNVGYGMVQVAIGISVGLYLSALVIYPFGKRRSGLFSF